MKYVVVNIEIRGCECTRSLTDIPTSNILTVKILAYIIENYTWKLPTIFKSY